MNFFPYCFIFIAAAAGEETCQEESPPSLQLLQTGLQVKMHAKLEDRSRPPCLKESKFNSVTGLTCAKIGEIGMCDQAMFVYKDGSGPETRARDVCAECGQCKKKAQPPAKKEGQADCKGDPLSWRDSAGRACKEIKEWLGLGACDSAKGVDPETQVEMTAEEVCPQCGKCHTELRYKPYCSEKIKRGGGGWQTDSGVTCSDINPHGDSTDCYWKAQNEWTFNMEVEAREACAVCGECIEG